MASLSKSKKQANATLDANGEPPSVSSKAKAPKDASSGKQGFIARITGRAKKTKLEKTKLEKTKSEKVANGVNGAVVPAALHMSKTEKELKIAFRVYDVDKDGRISIGELRAVLTSLGGEISEQELGQLMKEVDKDNDGFISLEEFIEFHHATAPVAVGGEISPVHDPMRDAFQMFDKDGDSRISASELQAVLVSLGERGHSLEECKQMIKSVDKDGDGYVDFLEFQELMGGQD